MRRGPAAYFSEAEYLTVAETAQLLRCSETTIYDACADGRLPAGKIGVQWLIKRAELDQALRRMAYALDEGEQPIPLRRASNG